MDYLMDKNTQDGKRMDGLTTWEKIEDKELKQRECHEIAKEMTRQEGLK